MSNQHNGPNGDLTPQELNIILAFRALSELERMAVMLVVTADDPSMVELFLNDRMTHFLDAIRGMG